MPSLGLAYVLTMMFVLLWIVDKYAPFPDRKKNIINSLTVTAMIWLLYAFGVFHPPGVII
jgi:hypothetical protein